MIEQVPKEEQESRPLRERIFFTLIGILFLALGLYLVDSAAREFTTQGDIWENLFQLGLVCMGTGFILLGVGLIQANNRERGGPLSLAGFCTMLYSGSILAVLSGDEVALVLAFVWFFIPSLFVNAWVRGYFRKRREKNEEF